MNPEALGKSVTLFFFKTEILTVLTLASIHLHAFPQESDSLKLLSDYQKSQDFISQKKLDSAIQLLTTIAYVAQSQGNWDLFTEAKIELARIYRDKEDVDQALRNYVELIRILSRDSLYMPLAKAYCTLARDYARFGLYNKAIFYFTRAGEYYDKADRPKEVVEVLIQQSELYLKLDQYELADSTLKSAINLIPKYNLDKDLLPLLLMQVKIYEYLEEPEKMLTTNLKIYEIYLEMKDTLKIVEILNHIGFNYAALDNFEKALSQFKESYKLGAQTNMPDSVLINQLIHIGAATSSLGAYSAAIDTLLIAEEYCKNDNRSDRLAKVQNLIAETYLKTGDLSTALIFSNKSIQNARLSGNVMVLRDCYRTHSDILQESDDFKNGLEFYQEYVKLNDSISRTVIDDRYDLSIREYDATINERRAILMVTGEEIEELEFQNLQKDFALLSAEQELQKIMQRRKFYIVVSLSLGIFLILIILGYFTKRRDNRLLNKQQQSILNINRELERKNAELRNAMDQLKMTQGKLIESEKMASLGQLTAGIAHEINNPVNFISSNVDPLKTSIGEIMEILRAYQRVSDSADTKQQLEKAKSLEERYNLIYLIEEMNALLKGISEGAQRTKEIVIGLRNFSRLDKQVLRQIDLHDLIESALLLLRNKYKERIQIVKQYDKGIPMIECYPGQLSQVFMNIISNAIQAIGKKGTILIQTELEEKNVLISISDNGTGMDETVLRKIFDPFYTTKEVGEGTGLGLSISYGIIQQHNGHIEVDSKPGTGTTFKILIPLHQTEKT